MTDPDVIDTGRLGTIRRDLRTLPRQFWLLVGGIFVYLVGVEMCFPFQTLYLSTRMHVSMTTIGLILGLTLLAGLPFQFVGGAAADRLGRRPVLMLGACGSMVLYIGLGVAHRFAIVVACFAFEAAFGWAMFLTGSNAMTADLTTHEQRAEAFSITRVALAAGTVLGPLLAAPLLKIDPTFRTPFIIAGAVCGVFLLMLILFFKETKPTVHHDVAAVGDVPLAEGLGAAAGDGDDAEDTAALGAGVAGAERTVLPAPAARLGGYGHVLHDVRFMLFCLVALLPLYCFGQIWATFPVLLEKLLGVSPQAWSLLLVLYGSAGALLQYPLIRWLRGRDNFVLMGVSSGLLGLGLGGAAFAPWGAPTALLVLVISVGVVLLVPISTTIVSHMAPTELRGRYMGVWTLVYLGGYGLGPLCGGFAMDALGARSAFVVVAAAGLLGAALFPLMRRRRHPDVTV